MKLLTIGHSNHSLDKFIRLLEANGVMTLVDVRTAPASVWSDWSEECLAMSLKNYSFLRKRTPRLAQSTERQLV